MRIIIAGNGILALSIAHRILQKDSKIELIIIGPGPRPGAATPAAAAMLNSFAEIEADSLRSEAGRKAFELSFLSTQMWPSFEHELIAAAGSNLPYECTRCMVLNGGGCYGMGTYIVHNATSDRLEDKNFRAIKAAVSDYNEQHSVVDPECVPGYAPAQAFRALEALYLPNEGWLNPKIVLKKLEKIVYTNARVRYIDDSVVGLLENNEKVSGFITKSGELVTGEEYVLAVGAFLSPIIRGTVFEDQIMPVFNSVGVSIEVRGGVAPELRSCIRSPNRGGGCGIYVVPYFRSFDDSERHYLVGASSVITINPRYFGRSVSVSHLLSSAIQEINQEFYNSEVVGINTGNRPVSLDQFPLLGRVGASNLHVVSGTRRDGFHNAPVISDYISNSLLCRSNSIINLEMFSPDRAPIREFDRNSGIEKYIESKLNEAYQHGFRPSSIFQVRQFERGLRDTITTLYDRTVTNDYGIPPALVSVVKEIMNDDQFVHLRKWF
jgi:glycine oxidase